MSTDFTKEEILNAIRKIDENPKLRTNRHSSTYDLLFENKTYPPILVLSIANEKKNGNEVTLRDFDNNVEIPFKILRDLGFQISKKHPDNSIDNKEEFKEWLITKLANKSGAIQSYLTSINWLSERFYENGVIKQKSIFEIDDKNLISKLYTEAKKLQKNKDSYIYNIDAPSYGDSSYFSASLKKYLEFLQLNPQNSSVNQSPNLTVIKNQIEFDIASFKAGCKHSGLLYSDKLITRFSSSLLTKPFVILTGLSGSGKTKLAQSFVEWICASDSQFKIVPVGADWTNREPLLGYPNGLKADEYITPDSGVLHLLIEASKEKNRNRPYFIILDEMNLSHVERYFADFLSIMESKDSIKLYTGIDRLSLDGLTVTQQIGWPKNIFIIGTVNIDETTYMFSPKVLDRANVIEFRITEDEIAAFFKNPSIPDLSKLTKQGANMAESFLTMAATSDTFKNEELTKKLNLFFSELKKVGAEFGYRTASEIIQLITKLKAIDPQIEDSSCLDIAIMQKLLPKLHGSRSKLVKVLVALSSLCVDEKQKEDFIKNFDTHFKDDFKSIEVQFKISFEKLIRMYVNVLANGFTSYAEA